MSRAQLKALAARQAMTTAAASAARQPAAEADADIMAVSALDYSSALPRARRRVVLTREQEYAYIRRDLVRLTFISLALLALMIILLLVLR